MDRDEIWERIEQVVGPAPEVRTDLEVVAEPVTRRDGLLYRKLRFAPEPGDMCPAWLIMPAEQTEPLPAVLCLHQTTRIGKDEPAGLGGIPDLHYARELASLGYVTLAPDYPRFGESQTDSYALGYASATMKGVWNHQRALDLLAALPEVDASRLGVIGHSLGGFNAMMVAARDLRLRCCVTSCGFTRFTWNDDEGRSIPGDIRDWGHPGYMPRIASQYANRAENLPWDFEDLLALLAPRPLFINAPVQDFFRVEGVRECVELCRDQFSELAVVYPECRHSFPPASREAAYGFLDRHLRRA